MLDMIEYQTCKKLLYKKSLNCDILHDENGDNNFETMNLQEIIQPYSGVILILQSCIETIYPTILSFYIGPWSDKFGRKPILHYALIGT